MVITWQWLVAGQFPFKSDRLGSTVHSAPETGRLPHSHRSTVGLNGDDWTLRTCTRNQWFGFEHRFCLNITVYDLTSLSWLIFHRNLKLHKLLHNVVLGFIGSRIRIQMLLKSRNEWMRMRSWDTSEENHSIWGHTGKHNWKVHSSREAVLVWEQHPAM